MAIPSKRIPLPLLIGTGAVIFLANVGLLVLQLVGGRFLAPFIGSSVETWTSIIGVFLTGIALGNWFGGRLADRFPSPRTVAVLLVLSGLASLGMIGWSEYALDSGFYKSIPLTPRIPILAAMFCLLPALLMSLLTPLTIKLLLPDVASAGRIAGLIFSLSTLGCLLGNYVTGFWLMAYLTLNTITMIVGFGLIALAIPVFLYERPISVANSADEAATEANASAIPDGSWNFRGNIRYAYAVVFCASFCGMSLELTGARILAPILGVSLFTWTGIIGVMLAGTASGNYLGGILADRGVGPTLRRFAVLIGALIGAAIAPVVARDLGLGINLESNEWLEYPLRFLGGALGIASLLPGLILCKSRRGTFVVAAIVGGLIGAVLAHTAFRAFDKAFDKTFVNSLNSLPAGWLIIHGVGFAVGFAFAALFLRDAPKKGEPVTGSGALSGALFLGGLLVLAILMLTGVFQQYSFMYSGDAVDKVLAWTFGLFFLPMLVLGTISPQVVRLSIADVKSAGRVAGSVYAWSTAGAIVGTFVTGYFLIGSVGTFRVLMLLAFILTLSAFFVGRLWKNNAMLYAASIICGGAICGLLLIGFGSSRYEMETKYYAIQINDDYFEGEHVLSLTLDHLKHSFVKPNDPLWLGYRHEYVQGELLQLARSRHENANLLIIGGGAYTFPRYVEVVFPDVHVDVVEIDPGVTEVAHRMGLPRDTTIHTDNMDGRQFVSEIAEKGHYDLVMQDAVNDLSVPYHLMTKEYNDAVKATLKSDGAYLLTLIDSLRDGKLWRAAVNTMRRTFPHVHVLYPQNFRDKNGGYSDQAVYIIYGSDKPFDLEAVEAVNRALYNRQARPIRQILSVNPIPEAFGIVRECQRKPIWTHVLEDDQLDMLVRQQKEIVLTDQYAPVDNLMSGIFRAREKKR